MSSHNHGPATFLDRYLNGEVLAEEMDDFIDVWHTDPQNKEIYEFLGMSEQEYSLWLRDPEALPHIARARRAGLPLQVVISAALKELRIAARSGNSAKLERLNHWLKQTEKISSRR
jgi:hypothetical protein